ncbi:MULTISPECIES: hypothetical protein [unclassified Rathayibacter]|uniref:hypothetical protein n=1 Tax=unclassified Rathayibacter TaxID=2609250 RepID=UPI0011B0A041|nr:MULTISPECIES: hypothetical protein [unclassified Rathayibacter]
MDAHVTPLPLDLTLQKVGLNEPTEDKLREMLSFLEAEARLSYCLLLPLIGLRGTDDRIPNSGGYRTYLNLLGSVSVRFSHNPNILRLVTLQLDAARLMVGDKSANQLRNFLSHGGIASPIPPEDFQALRSAVSEIFHALKQLLIGKEIGLDDSTPFLKVTYTGVVYENPLVCIRNGSIGFFQSLRVNDGIFAANYYMLDRWQPECEVEIEDADRLELLRSFLQTSIAPEDPEIKQFKSAIRRDLEPFSERGQPIQFDVASTTSPFVVTWQRRISEGVDRRVDTFRIRAGDRAREWKREGADDRFGSYLDLLREISSWTVLVPRLLEAVVDSYQTKSRWDLENFGSFSVPENLLPLEPFVKDIDRIGESFLLQGASSESTLVNKLDSSVALHKGVSQIYFLSGEAGVGKTHNLINMARTRLRHVSESQSIEPLFLYIDCSGVRLSSLEAVLDATVAATIVLTADRIATLCRNGLVVLVIDGFDELLGGAGYRDAYDTLKPLLGKLGHNGTIVISARSSYLANQYRASLDSAADPFESTDHWILEMGRWPVETINQIFETNPSWFNYRFALTQQDKELLRLPFFARVFDHFVQTSRIQNSAVNTVDLVDILLDAYLRRELNKLTHGRVVGVTVEDLRDILIECAGQMWELGERELSKEDFLLAALVGLGIEAFSGRHQYLGDRLTVLCGISAATAEENRLSFTFDHERYYDALIVPFLLRRIRSGNQSLAADRITFGKEVLGTSIVEAIVRQEGEMHSRLVNLAGAGSEFGGNVSANVGSMISAYAETQKWFAGGAALLDLSIDKLNMVGLSVGRTELVRCAVRILTIDFETTGIIGLSGSRVDVLRIVSGSRAADPALTFEPGEGIDVGELHIVDDSTGRVLEVVSGLSKVAEELTRIGFDGLDRLVVQNRGLTPLEVFSQSFLSKVVSRQAMNFVIDDRFSTPGETASSWIPRPDDPLWPLLVNALVDSGVAQRKRINAAGFAKAKISFVVEPSVIIGSDEPSDERIVAFWALLRARS